MRKDFFMNNLHPQCWEYVADTFDLAHVPKIMFTYEQARNEASTRNDSEKRK